MNCIISIDGKIPCSSIISNLYLVINNEDSAKVKFEYVLGDFIVDSSDYQLLLKNKDKKATISFEQYVQGEDRKKYKGDIEVVNLLDSYCILEFTNYKKNKYSFGFRTSTIGTVLGKKDKTVLLDP